MGKKGEALQGWKGFSVCLDPVSRLYHHPYHHILA